MKSSSDVEMVDKESILLMCKAAELFIKNLATESYKTTDNAKKLDYKNLAQIVHLDDKYEFLRDIMPKKITVSEFKRIMAKKQAEEGGKRDANMSSSSEDDDSSSSSSSGDDDDSSSGSEESNASAWDLVVLTQLIFEYFLFKHMILYCFINKINFKLNRFIYWFTKIVVVKNNHSTIQYTFAEMLKWMLKFERMTVMFEYFIPDNNSMWKIVQYLGLNLKICY